LSVKDIFEINAVLLNFLFIKESWKKVSWKTSVQKYSNSRSKTTL